MQLLIEYLGVLYLNHVFSSSLDNEKYDIYFTKGVYKLK